MKEEFLAKCCKSRKYNLAKFGIFGSKIATISARNTIICKTCNLCEAYFSHTFHHFAAKFYNFANLLCSFREFLFFPQTKKWSIIQII